MSQQVPCLLPHRLRRRGGPCECLQERARLYYCTASLARCSHVFLLQGCDSIVLSTELAMQRHGRCSCKTPDTVA